MKPDKKYYLITASPKTLPALVSRKEEDGYKPEGKPVKIGGGKVCQKMTMEGRD